MTTAIQYISSFSILIPFLVIIYSMWTHNIAKDKFLLIEIYIICGFVVQIILVVLMLNGEPNIFPASIFLLVEVILLSAFFSSGKYLIYGIIGGIAGFIINIAGGLSSPPAPQVHINCLILSLLTVRYLYYSTPEYFNENSNKNEYEIKIAAAVLAYSLLNPVTYGFIHKIPRLSLNIHAFSNIAMNLLLTWGSLCYYKYRK